MHFIAEPTFSSVSLLYLYMYMFNLEFNCIVKELFGLCTFIIEFNFAVVRSTSG